MVGGGEGGFSYQFIGEAKHSILSSLMHYTTSQLVFYVLDNMPENSKINITIMHFDII